MKLYSARIPVLLCSLIVGTQLSCDQPSVPVVPKKESESASTESGEATSEEAEPELQPKTPVKIPAPTPKLLNKAHSAVRLGNDQFDGSGVIIHRDDQSLYILTVAHAVRERINRVEIFAGKETPVAELNQVKVLSKQERADLALIQVPISDDIETTVARIAKLKEDDPQPTFGYSVGCGDGKPPTTHREHILGAHSIRIELESGSTNRYMWRTESPQEQGRSGGPLLDVNGDLLGIALGKYADRGYYAHLREISEYLIDNGLVTLVTYGDRPLVADKPQGK